MQVEYNDLMEFLGYLVSYIRKEHDTGQYYDIKDPAEYVETCFKDLLIKEAELKATLKNIK